MKITPTHLPEVLLIEPIVFGDERGFFYESFSQRVLDEAVGRHIAFVQDNHSKSQRGVLRGLHFQMPPHAQGKLVRVVQGEVFDVAVDIRKNSPHFGQWIGVHLSAENKHQLWIPEGFAHGFLTLSKTAELVYKTTSYYASQFEKCIRWNDETLKIDWPTVDAMLMSNKDSTASFFSECDLP